MKYCFIIFLTMLLLSCDFKNKSDAVKNGILIDCARLLEHHEYYYRLIDFMAEWEMNTLILHFSDDHGLSIKIPGFEKLARQIAFTPQEINNLIDHGKKKGIEIIPELEVFGHTRYITDHPDYHHLYIGEKSNTISFNAINPLNRQTVKLMDSLITMTATLFPSKYLHLGCDEVNIKSFCESKGLNEAAVWTNYVNNLIEIAHRNNKIPIIWNDHVRKNKNIANQLNKNVILMEWNYDPNYKPTKLKELLQLGFQDIIMAPSIACYRLRVLPAWPGLKNTYAMATSVFNGTATGLINTIWLPMRYLQNAMWYGIAYSGYLVNSKSKMNLTAFHEKFLDKVFDTNLTNDLDHYLTDWTKLHLDHKFYKSMIENDLSFSPEELKTLQEINSLSKELINNQPEFEVKKNRDILASMFLATRVIYVVSEGLIIFGNNNHIENRKLNWQKELYEVTELVDKEWDKGRYPDDPEKYQAKFVNQEHSYLLIILKKLAKVSMENTSIQN